MSTSSANIDDNKQFLLLPENLSSDVASVEKQHAHDEEKQALPYSNWNEERK